MSNKYVQFNEHKYDTLYPLTLLGELEYREILYGNWSIS